MVEVVAFPLERRGDLVVRTGRVLLSMDADRGRAWWKAHAAEMRAELKARGLKPKAIAVAMKAYSAAVTMRVRTVEMYGRLQQPEGGAA